jgi:precorrin-2 dehydrogenase
MLYLFGCTSESEFWDHLIKRNDSQRDLSRILKEKGLRDFAILATCHRWECYWYDEDPNRVDSFKSIIKEYLFSDPNSIAAEFSLTIGPAVINHLFRVSSGLDSLIIGEHEILGQVRDCLKEAMELRTVGPMVGTLLREASRIGKKVRNQTTIGRGKVSYASLIGELIEKHSWLNPLADVLIIGSGKLAKGVGELLFKKGIKPYFIAGRNLEKAEELALKYHGQSAPLEQLPQLLNRFSLVIGASKANRTLIQSSDLALITRQQLLIDLSVPGIIDADFYRYKNIQYIGLNIIECMIQENLQQRQAEIEEVEFLVAGAVEEMVIGMRQRQRQEQIGVSQEKLYLDGQSALDKLLSEVPDEGLKQAITKQWDDQLRKLIYLALSAEKNERLLPHPVLTNNFFPLILSLASRKVVVVGGGKVAARKVSKLLEAQAQITIIAPELESALFELSKQSQLIWQKSCFKPEQIAGFDLVIAATNDHEVNMEIVTAARKAKILVNSVDEAVYSDFLFPAIVRRGDLLIAISTSGKRPALARKIRQELEFLFGQEYGELLDERVTKP